MTVACTSAVQVLLRPLILILGTLHLLHEDLQEKLIAELISRNNAPFNSLRKYLLSSCYAPDAIPGAGTRTVTETVTKPPPCELPAMPAGGGHGRQ